jgi:hypothetical protein
LFLFVCLLLCVKNQLFVYPGAVSSFECPVLNGFFKNNADCTACTECINGVPYGRQCMSGTVFDVTRQKCTWSSLVTECKMAADKSVKGVSLVDAAYGELILLIY